jgi:hypothetical protein
VTRPYLSFEVSQKLKPACARHFPEPACAPPLQISARV